MKRTIALTITLALLVCSAAPIFAEHDAGEKLKNGAETIYTIPYDIYKTTSDETKEAEFKPFGFLGGMLKGIAYGVKDLATGLVDVVTFPVDLNG